MNSIEDQTQTQSQQPTPPSITNSLNLPQYIQPSLPKNPKKTNNKHQKKPRQPRSDSTNVSNNNNNKIASSVSSVSSSSSSSLWHSQGEKINLSKKLSYHLRHDKTLSDKGLRNSEGFVSVTDMMKMISGLTLPRLVDIVQTDNKNRFSLKIVYQDGTSKEYTNSDANNSNSNNNQEDKTDENAGVICIRANQGHSVQV